MIKTLHKIIVKNTIRECLMMLLGNVSNIYNILKVNFFKY